jgi:hypothetical protein
VRYGRRSGKKGLSAGEEVVFFLADSLKKLPSEIRSMSSSDVFGLLKFYKEQGKRQRNEVDIDDLSSDQVVQMFGAENG